MNNCGYFYREWGKFGAKSGEGFSPSLRALLPWLSTNAKTLIFIGTETPAACFDLAMPWQIGTWCGRSRQDNQQHENQQITEQEKSNDYYLI